MSVRGWMLKKFKTINRDFLAFTSRRIIEIHC